MEFCFFCKEIYISNSEIIFDEQNKSLKMMSKKYYNKRSQELKDYYHDAGQFYWETDAWLSNKLIFGKNSTIHLLDYFDSHDVDIPTDWRILEKLYYLRNTKKYVRKKK